MNKKFNISDYDVNPYNIMSNDDGDFVFELKDRATHEIVGTVVLPYKSGIEDLITFYHGLFGFKPDILRKVFDMIHNHEEPNLDHEIAVINKHINDDEYSFANVLKNENHTIWNLCVYESQNKIREVIKDAIESDEISLWDFGHRKNENRGG